MLKKFLGIVLFYTLAINAKCQTYNDSFVISNECSPYKLVTYAISDRYCFYKEYLGGILRETGYLSKPAHYKSFYPEDKDSLINTYNSNGELIKIILRRKNVEIYNEQYDDGLLTQRSTLTFYKSIPTNDGRWTKNLYYFSNSFYNNLGQLTDSNTFISHGSKDDLKREFIVGKDSLQIDYYNSRFELEKSEFYVKNDLVSIQIYSDQGKRYVMQFRNAKNIDSIYYFVGNKVHYKYYENEKTILFDFTDTSFKLGSIKGVAYLKDDLVRVYIKNEKDSIELILPNDGTNTVKYYLNNILTMKTVFNGTDELYNLVKFSVYNNRFPMFDYLLYLLITKGTSTRNQTFRSIISYHKDGSVFKYMSQSGSSYAITKNSHIYMFKEGEMLEENINRVFHQINKDIRSCQYGVQVNEKWVIEPAYERVNILENRAFSPLDNILFQCYRNDTTYIRNLQGKTILNILKGIHYKIVTINPKHLKYLKTQDSMLILCNEKNNLKLYTFDGKLVYDKTWRDCQSIQLNYNSILLKFPNKTTIYNYDDSYTEINDSNEYTPLYNNSNWLVAKRKEDNGYILYSLQGNFIECVDYHRLNEDIILCISNNRLISLNLKNNGQNKICNIDNGANFLKYIGYQYDSEEKYEYVKYKNKWGVYSLTKNKLIQPIQYDTIFQYSKKFMIGGKIGLFSDNYTKIMIKSCDELQQVYGIKNSKTSFFIRNKNKWKLINENGKQILKEPFDQWAEDTKAQTYLLFRGNELLLNISEKINKTSVKNSFESSYIHVIKQNSKYGLVNKEQIILPPEYTQLKEVSNNINILNESVLKNYAVKYSLVKENKKYTYSTKDGLKNLTEDYNYIGTFNGKDFGLTKTGLIKNLSCSEQIYFPENASVITQSDRIIWYTYAKPKSKEDYDYTDGTWHIGYNNGNLTDTFLSPSEFKSVNYGSNYMIRDKRKRWFLFSSDFKKLIDYGFDSFNEKDGYLYLQKAGKNYYYNSYKGLFPLQSINTIKYQNDFFTFTNDTIYMQSDDGKYNKYSTNLFLNQIHLGEIRFDDESYESNIKKEWTIKSYLDNLNYLLRIKGTSDMVLGHRSFQSSDEDYHEHDNYFPPLNYYIKTFDSLKANKEEEIISSIEGEYINPSQEETWYNNEQPKTTNTPKKLTIKDLGDLADKNILQESEEDSFAYVKHNDYKTTNLFIKLHDGIYTYNLTSIVDSTKYLSFNNYIFSKLSKLNNLNFPCVSGSDFIKYFDPNFRITRNEIILIDGSGREIALPLKDCLKYFNTWSRKNMFGLLL